MNFVLTFKQGFYLTLFIVSLFPLAGAFANFGLMHFMRDKDRAVKVFTAFLMMALAIYLISVNILERSLTHVGYFYIFIPFVFGFIVIYFIMALHERFFGHSHSLSLGILLLAMAMIHEVVEGAGFAEVFSGVAGAVPFSASQFFIMVLALHEFPEGMLLALPFFLAGKKWLGILATIVNLVTFVISALIFFFFFVEGGPTGIAEVFFHAAPAGGIFALAFFEIKIALEQKGSWGSARSKIVLASIFVLIIVGLGVALIGVKRQIGHHQLPRQSGTEVSPITGEEIPVYYADPCEHELNLEDCLDN